LNAEAQTFLVSLDVYKELTLCVGGLSNVKGVIGDGRTVEGTASDTIMFLYHFTALIFAVNSELSNANES
jgi:hypothetical protein